MLQKLENPIRFAILNFPEQLNSRIGLPAKVVYFFVATLVVFFLAQHWAYDDPFITYRYALNLANGNGFIYNSGEQVLSTTTPFFTLLLAVFSRLWSDLPQLAVMMGAASLAGGALVLYEMACTYRAPVVAWLCLLLYPTFPMVLFTLGSETPLYIFLALISIMAYQKKHYAWTGLFSALLILTRPDGLLVPALLAVHFIIFARVRQALPWKAIVLFIVINLAWFGFAWLYFGSPLPVTLAAKQRQGLMNVSEHFLPGLLSLLKAGLPNWNFRIAAVLASIGILFSLKNRQWLLVCIWTLAYLAVYALLGVTRYYWYYAPLVPCAVILIATGVNVAWGEIAKLKGWPFYAGASILLCLFGVVMFNQLGQFIQIRYTRDKRIPVYREVGLWMAANSPAKSSIGVLEIGVMGYYSQRKMIDFAGLLYPDIAMQLSRDSTYEDAASYALATYHPDYIVLQQENFQGVRRGAMARFCQQLRSFQNEDIKLDLFKCVWK